MSADRPAVRIKYSPKGYRELCRIKGAPPGLMGGPWLLVEIENEAMVHASCTTRRNAETAMNMYNKAGNSKDGD